MVAIDNFDLMRAVRLPDEADPILVVDTNAVLSVPIASQALEPVSRGNPQVGQCAGAVKHQQLSQGSPPEARRESPALSRFPEQLSFGIGEALDHTPDINRSRY